MQAILPGARSRSRPYGWGMISVEPEPPRVGREATIGFPLANPGPDAVVVEQIAVKVALFGIGVEWEEIGVLGPIRLEPDPAVVQTHSITWTPSVGGHRCVRATFQVEGASEPLIVGRNLQIIEASADEDVWVQRFRLGNPRPEAAPLVLALGGNHLDEIGATVRVAGRETPAGQPIWLQGGEVVAAELELIAETDAAIDAIRTVEASTGGTLIDGIEVIVRRPARIGRAVHAELPLVGVASSRT
jgi:hypothetical protein